MNRRSRKILKPLLVIAQLTCGSLALSQDGPDLAREARLHKLYKQLNEAPTPEDAWKVMAEQGNTQTYTIQEGDTLWDISETLFGDPQFYPKIWSLNGQDITNPHEIDPEEVIHFTEGTFGEAPSMALRDQVTSDFPVRMESTQAPAQPDADGVVAPDELPAPGFKSGPVRNIPASLPPWEASPKSSTSLIFAGGKSTIPKVSPDVYLDTYLQEGAILGDGVVAETEVRFNTATSHQIVYVKMNAAPTASSYLVVQAKRTTTDPFSGEKAMQVLAQGEIEILGVANASKNLYRALVKNVANQVEIGGVLVPGHIPLMNAQETGGLTTAPARVIGGAHDEQRNFFGPNEIVFLNEGSQKGIVEGQMLAIYKNQALRNSDTDVTENPMMIGRLKVLKVTQKFSTAIVTGSSEEIRVGDATDPGMPQITGR